MTYNTGNALGSTDPRDLYDNAENLDKLANGPGLSYADRLGAPRKSWAGMEADFQNFLLASGYQDLGTYAAGLTITARNQIFERSGLLYRLASIQALPYTTTGSWAGESGKFVVITDASLRPELANGGSALVDSAVVGYGSGSVKDELDRIAAGGIRGAAGNGLVDDTSAFAAFEASVYGRAVDLGGKTYLVTAIPSKNAYYNGTWLVGGNRRIAMLKRSFLDGSPKFHAFGGQLRALRDALGDPFVQYLGIVFIGDSITWGTGATGTAVSTPRDGTLSDPRDYYATASYVNEFKRYVQQRYAPASTPLLSNHPASASGESVVEYQRENIMYPRYGDFTLTQAAGANMTITDSLNVNLIGGGQLQLASSNEAVENSHAITFNFTGSSFRLYFSCVESTSTYYELLVDGVLVGTYSMKAGAAATSGVLVDGSTGNYNDHAFSFVRNKVVTIRTKRGGDTLNRIARFEAVRILKRIVIKNQGINGAAARTYGNINLSGSFGDGVAVESTDSFVFCQLGTNDRIIASLSQYARGVNILSNSLATTLNYLHADAKTILMCANPSANESPATYWLNMQDVRDTLIRVAESRALDFVDNFSAFSNVDMNTVTSDGLHPNDLGYAIIARNIINSLESA